jgi:hypothetical protein
VTTDPGPFLSTIVGTSATLVAIVGGLLVARFVGLDSDQRTSRKVVGDAFERLAAARDRAAAAWRDLLAWDADDFFRSEVVLKAIDAGAAELGDLARLGDWPHGEDDLRPFVAEVADEFLSARTVLPGILSVTDMKWRQFRRTATQLPEIRWAGAWEYVYDAIMTELVEEAKDALDAAADEDALLGGLYNSINRMALDVRSPARRKTMQSPSGASDARAAAARRHVELAAARQRALQQVEEYESECRRSLREHAFIMSPDVRLWWGVGIVVAFAVVGVAVPLWVLGEGPKDLATVRWLFWLFAAGLAALLGYIVVYLALLTRSRQPQ